MASLYDDAFHKNLKLLDRVIKTSHNLRSDLKDDMKMAILGLLEVFNDMKSAVLEGSIEQKAPCCERAVQTSLHQPPAESRSYPSYSEVLRKNQPDRSINIVSVLIKPSAEGVSAEEIKSEIKAKVNPVELNVGVVKMFSTARGGVIVQTKTKLESEKLCSAINTACSSSASAVVANKRLPRVIIYNVPAELTTSNAVEIIVKQNPEIFPQGVQFSPKLILSPKNIQRGGTSQKEYRHLVVECMPSIRKRLISSQIKIMWSICHAKDYIFVRRCFNCSLFHNGECKGQRACPICAKDHDFRACHKSQAFRQCNSCLKHNEQSRSSSDRFDANHTAFDNHCPIYLRTVERIRRTINYNDDDE